MNFAYLILLKNIACLSKWMNEWVFKRILIPNLETAKITSYTLANKYERLNVSDIGFTK